MSWWKFWESGYDRSENNLPPITNTIPMPKVKTPRGYGPGDVAYVNSNISEPVFAIVESIMKDKKRWQFWADGVKGGSASATWNKEHSHYDRYRYTTCVLKDTKTSTELKFKAVLSTSSNFSLYRGFSSFSKVYLVEGYKFYIIDNIWMTEKEKEYVIETLSMWWQIRCAKATSFYEGVEGRRAIRSKALQEKLAKQERERLMNLFCTEQAK